MSFIFATLELHTGHLLSLTWSLPAHSRKPRSLPDAPSFSSIFDWTSSISDLAIWSRMSTSSLLFRISSELAASLTTRSSLDTSVLIRLRFSFTCLTRSSSLVWSSLTCRISGSIFSISRSACRILSSSIFFSSSNSARTHSDCLSSTSFLPISSSTFGIS